jgi:hypothetical protein
MPRIPLFFAAPAMALAIACSSSTDTAKGGASAHCTMQRDACFAKQLTCASNAGTESCVACPVNQYAVDPDTCAPIPGTAMHHTFDPVTLTPGQEIDGLCHSWTLGNEEELWVNAVELETNGGYHHSNWLFAPDTQYVGPDGEWPCKDRGYDELSAAVSGGVLFAQSTQAKHQVQKFQDGVAVHLPPHARIIGGTHLLNISESTIETNLSLSIYTLPQSDVKVPLAPFRLTYSDLSIQPQAISEFTGTCDFAAAVPNGNPTDLDMDLYYILPHYHALGHSFHLEKLGGPDDAKAIYDLGAFDGEAHGTPLNPPVSMRGSEGFRFTCGFQNPRDAVVHWGIGDQEMCVMLGFARSDYAFDGDVQNGSSTPAPKKNGAFEFTGNCTVLPLPFARGKGSLSPDPTHPDGGTVRDGG